MVRFVESGGESGVDHDDGLAPVISLFGERGGGAYPKTVADVRKDLDGRAPATTRDSDVGTPDERPIDLGSGRAGRARSGEVPIADDHSLHVVEAEQGLLKRLRGRQLSVTEARAFLGQYELSTGSTETILDDFLRRGYLDDARLAEQIVHAGVDRKRQGRQAISQTLARRGVARDIADAALAELQDDDAERALEFARSKAGSMRGLERDAALRRLTGQLARRGYSGSVALTAARQALDELARPSGRVRFE